jgi:hypothetical protein
MTRDYATHLTALVAAAVVTTTLLQFVVSLAEPPFHGPQLLARAGQAPAPAPAPRDEAEASAQAAATTEATRVVALNSRR